VSVPRFWREIPQRYNLEATRCGSCQSIHFPPREVCPTCRRESIGKMTSVKLSGKGVILEWTRVHRAARGYVMQVPYVMALVRTEEGPIVAGQIVDVEGATVEAGAAVQSVFRRLGSDGDAGVIYYGTKWRLSGAGAAPGPAAKGKKGRKR
jgi:uncharacterized OB-fold protein